VEALRQRDAGDAARRAVAHIRNLAHELINYLEIPAELLHSREAQIWPQLGLAE
jgi:hypothetical protein